MAKNPNHEFDRTAHPTEKMAVWVTDRVGTVGFFFVIFTWSLLWLSWNTFGPEDHRFDPAPAFVLWLIMSNMIQLTLMPLIMIGQNIKGRKSDIQIELDYQQNLRMEKEIEYLKELTLQMKRSSGRG